MQTKIVYTLVSDVSDTYLEQALLSVYSLRLHNPQAIVELVVDQFTAKTIVGKREEIKRYITNLIEIDVPEELNKVQRSRYLKTNLRKFIKGDYLFIDCDTVICDKLDEIDDFEGEIGMAADLNGKLLLFDQNTIKKCQTAGFDSIEGNPYYNSGVMFVKDCPISYLFYEEWYFLWRESLSHGIMYDQPALAQSNINLNFPIKELIGIWNCQVKFYGYKFINSARFIHYYSINGVGSPYAQDRIFEYIKGKGMIDKAVDNIMRHPDTIFYSVMTINDDKAFEYFNSSPIYLYQNVPSAFRIFEGLSSAFMKLYLFCSKIKNWIKL